MDEDIDDILNHFNELEKEWKIVTSLLIFLFMNLITDTNYIYTT